VEIQFSEELRVLSVFTAVNCWGSSNMFCP